MDVVTDMPCEMLIEHMSNPGRDNETNGSCVWRCDRTDYRKEGVI